MKNIHLTSPVKYADTSKYEKVENGIFKILGGEHAGWFAMNLSFAWSKDDKDDAERLLYRLNSHISDETNYRAQSVIVDQRINDTDGLLEVNVSNLDGVTVWKNVCGKFVYLEYIPTSAEEPLFELVVSTEEKSDYYAAERQSDDSDICKKCMSGEIQMACEVCTYLDRDTLDIV